jgi:hypothetical protein
MEGKRDALHMRNNAANGLFCEEGKATRFSRATNVWLCAKPERRRLSRGNPRVGFDSLRPSGPPKICSPVRPHTRTW